MVASGMDNFRLLSKHFPQLACYCEGIQGVQKLTLHPPTETFPTIDAAIARLPDLLFNTLKLSQHPQVLKALPADALKFKMFLTWDIIGGKYKPLTAERIKKEFKKHPSVAITGFLYFFEDKEPTETVTTMLQGAKEIEKYLASPPAQELSQCLADIGALSSNVGGIVVKPAKKKSKKSQKP